MVVREFVRLKCLAVLVSGYRRSKAAGFWWMDTLRDYDRILGYAWISIISTYCCFCTFSAHVQSAHTRPPCANPRARWPTTSNVPTVPKPWLLRTESDQDQRHHNHISKSVVHFPLQLKFCQTYSQRLCSTQKS